MKPAAWLATLFIASCSIGCITGPGERKDLERREWTLTQIQGQTPLNERRPTLTLANDGRVAGRSGANRYFGTYAHPAAGVIRFAALGSTKMYLDDPPGLMEQEQLFLETLGEIDAYRVRPDRLILLSGKKVRLRFEPSLPETGR